MTQNIGSTSLLARLDDAEKTLVERAECDGDWYFAELIRRAAEALLAHAWLLAEARWIASNPWWPVVNRVPWEVEADA